MDDPSNPNDIAEDELPIAKQGNGVKDSSPEKQIVNQLVISGNSDFVLPGVVAASDDSTVELQIERAVQLRDAFWRARVRDSIDGQVKIARQQLQDSITRKCSAQIDVERKKTAELQQINDDLHSEIAVLQKDLHCQVLRNAELQTEIEAGKRMIRQFSELIKDKASAVCQYCRRSGTLPPLPTR